MDTMTELLKRWMDKGVREGCFASGTAAVGCRDQVLAQTAVGQLWLPDGPKTDLFTRYDMASCSKILGPTMLALKALENGLITLDDTIGQFLNAPEGRKGMTIRQLMTHTSGIVPSMIMENYISSPADVADFILSLPLEGPAGEPRYTCFGYIILTKILEKVYGDPLDVLAERYVFGPLQMKHTGYNPKGDNIAATELDKKTGKPWIGVVHDENARFQGGVSGNAGVFSDLGDMIRFAQMLAKMGGDYLAKSTMTKAIHNYTPGFDVHRGLGFHLGGTNCNYLGDLMPENSFGHTGFTGTSIAVEPETGYFVVLLTNRVYPTRENLRHMRFRRQLHNVLWTAFCQGTDRA